MTKDEIRGKFAARYRIIGYARPDEERDDHIRAAVRTKPEIIDGVETDGDWIGRMMLEPYSETCYFWFLSKKSLTYTAECLNKDDDNWSNCIEFPDRIALFRWILESKWEPDEDDFQFCISCPQYRKGERDHAPITMN